jgi:hypothetical protein
MKLGPHPAHSRSLIDGSENDDEMSTMRQTTHPPRLSVRFPARPSDVIDGNFWEGATVSFQSRVKLPR